MVCVYFLGNYSRLASIFYFGRSLGYYLIHIYVPSCLIVVLSWVSFWLSRDAVPARVALGITTVLTMTTLISSTNASLPKISYLKSIDIYLLICFVMVFASLLEYAAVSYITKRSKRVPKRRGSDITHIPPPPPRCDHHRGPPRSPSKNRTTREYQQDTFNTVSIIALLVGLTQCAGSMMAERWSNAWRVIFSRLHITVMLCWCTSCST